MKTLHSPGFVVLRSAVLSVDEVAALGEGLRSARACRDDLDAALEGDRQELTRRLRAVVAEPHIRDALFVASPEVDRAVTAWLKGAPDGKLELALTRYLARMGARATPFGLFAGCAVGEVAAPACLELGPHGDDQIRVRLDANLLAKLVEQLEREPELRGVLTYRPNPTLYEAHGRLRYVEAGDADGRRASRLVSVAPMAELDAVLSAAVQGGTVAALAAVIAGTGASEQAQARAFVEELIEAQVLVSELEPAVVGPEPAGALARRLRALAPSLSVTSTFESVLDALSHAQSAAPGTRSARMRDATAIAGELGIETAGRAPFHVELVKSAPSLRVPALVLDELRTAIDVMHRLHPAGEQHELARFRERFEDRYGDRVVALAEALDQESGVGYPAPGAASRGAASGLGAQPGERFLLGLVTGTPQGADAVIDPLDPRLPETALLPLPDAFAAFAVLAAEDDEAIDRGEFEARLLGVGGPSAAKTLGRFCHSDPVLERCVSAQLRAEEALDSDAVFAEVAHRPAGPAANIVVRPALRSHQIVLVAGSEAQGEARIVLSDLDLTLAGGEFVLWSRSLGRRVVPCLTTAHAASDLGIGLYRFLAAIEGQRSAVGMSFEWGRAAGAPYTPRVRVGRVILSPAGWRLEPSELESLAAGSDAERFAGVQLLRHARQLPRFVTLGSWDAAALIDLDNPLSVDLLLRTARKGQAAELSEYWPDHGCAAVRGPGGRHAHEFVIPFTVAPAHARRRPQFRPLRHGSAPHTYPPGSEWLYAKIYGGPAGADRLLTDYIGPFVRRCTDAGDIDGWHFIRYGDPDHHLRLRLHGDPSPLNARVRPALEATLAPLIESGLVWRLQFDSYQREIARYGGDSAIALCEQAFAADSTAVLALLDGEAAGQESAELRWRSACMGVASLWRDLGIDDTAGAALAVALRDRLAGPSLSERSLSTRFRGMRGELEDIVGRGLRAEPDPGDLQALILGQRSTRMAPIAAALSRLEQSGRLERSLHEIASSLAHMHINRFLRGGALTGEVLIYDTLARVLRSRAARERAFR